MNISIFGLGRVGCVEAACCAQLGHHVIGHDNSRNKVRLVNQGLPTVREEGLADLVRQARDQGRLEATMDSRYAVHQSGVSFIAVRTPRGREGQLSLNNVAEAARQIGEALKDKNAFHIIAVRSTVPPGTGAKVTEWIAEASGKQPDVDFAVVSNPEFMRRGSSVQDFMNPPMTLLGSSNAAALETLRELFRDFPGEIIVTEPEVAEIVKLVSNTFHALKVVFGNEVGNICKSLNIDSHKVMDIFCRDRQLNISPQFLMPGFAYGGSCLPKDSRALRAIAHAGYVTTPVIDAISVSNEQQKKNAIEIIEGKGRRKVGILGLSFKPGTDDVRNSPIVDVAQALYGNGFELRIYDRNVKMDQLTGSNADFIAAKLPYLGKILTDDLDAVCAASDVLVIATREKDFDTLPRKYPHKCIVDLVRQFPEIDYDGNYEGISWGSLNTNPGQETEWPRDMLRSMF